MVTNGATTVWAQPWQQKETDLEALVTADTASSVPFFDPELRAREEDGSVCDLVCECCKWFVVQGFIS